MKETSANFGAIKDTVYNFSAKELISESTKKITILNEFFNLIKENSILKLQYLIYKNLENGTCKKEYLAERYINQNLRLIENVKWNDITRTNKETKVNLLGNYQVEAENNKHELYEAIHTLIKSVTQPGFNDIDLAQESFDLVMEHLMKDKSSIVPLQESEQEERPKFLSWKYVTEYAVNKFNERYSHLNESERDLLKVLLSSEENKISYFEDLKKENLEMIENVLTENIDEATTTAINKFKNKILSLNESTRTATGIDDAIINLVELRDSLNSIGEKEGVNH